MRRLKRAGLGALVLPLVLLAQPAEAEVVAKSDAGFVVRVAAEVPAKPADAWKTMISPAQWWQSQHTFSGDATNLTLDPVTGGCFCETLPRPEGSPATQKPGGVQHMRVVYIEPPRAMRLVGALGPLQSEALSGTMTMTIKPTDKGSRILFEYVVGGYMRYKVDEIALAVDRMLSAQLASLAGKLGAVAEPEAPAAKSDGPMGPADTDSELPPAASDDTVVRPLSGAENYRLPPARSATRAPTEKASPIPAKKPPSEVASPPPSKVAAKPAAKPVLATSATAALAKPAAKPVAKPVGKAGAKPATKAAPKVPNPLDEEHRDANAAFDALLGAAPAP
jgi:hypothetical protein